MNNDQTPNSELALRIQNNSTASSSQKRMCWVCFGSDQDDEDESDIIWISPCQCKGTMKWVHEECLQRWIDEKQKRTNTLRVTCSQCKTHYILCFPPVNYVVRLMEQYDKLLYGLSPFIAVSVVVGSIYWCCGSYGFVSIVQIMGYDEARRLLDDADPLLLVIGLPVIPIGLVLAKLIKWEDFILKLWQRSANNLPRPLSYLVDKPPAKPRANCDQILQDPGFNEPLGCTRMICGALLLPSVSVLVGKVFFSRFITSQWRRSLIGGLAFLLLKGAMKIYLRKSQYIRYSQRSIKNYLPSAKSSSSQTGTGLPPGSLNDQSSGEGYDGSLAASGLNRHHLDSLDSDDLDDDSSDEEDMVLRTRTMFSMTISLGR